MTSRTLYLALTLLPLAAHAQTRDDSLKGRIWTATAQRIWVDTRPHAPQPPAWSTNAAFKSWLSTANKNENGGLGLLLGDVIRATGKGRPATAAAVAQAILTEASQPPKSREWLQKLNQPALRAALQKITPLAAAPTPAVTDTAARGPVATAGDSTFTPPVLPANATITDDSTLFSRHPWLAGLLGALVGAGLAAVALRSLRRQHRHRHRSPESLATPFTAPGTLQDSAEVLRLQNEVQRLAHYIKGLEAKLLHYENANAADVALADAEPAPALEAPIAPAELPHPPAVPVKAAVPAAPAAYYASVPATPYLADAQLVTEPHPELPLQLTPDPDDLQQATFTLSPHASQALLLAGGLPGLQAFFEYDPTPDDITLLEAAAPGRLQRQGAGWQVVERGWLAVS